MSAVTKVLIVGGGSSGMSLAICLRRIGVEVDLIERDPDWRAVGAGLSLNGASLAAFKRVGVLERMGSQGHFHAGLELYDISGKLLHRAVPPPDPSGLPTGGGILRPVLHQILAEATRAAGARARLGVAVASLRDEGSGVLVRTTDGEERRYELVVGADGLHSQIRELVFPEAPSPRFTGQGCWRAVFPRPAGLDYVRMYMDTHHKAGLNPVSRDEMYMFLLEHVPDNRRMPEELWPGLLAERLAPFGGIWQELRASLSAESRINYRPLEMLLLPSPWYRGRVVLIGDAAHATTPHAAYGCGLAVEDAIVLAEELGRESSLDAALTRFMQRRFERCRAVVQGSARLGELEMAHASVAEHQAVSAALGRAIAQPV
ncbi:MAG TPA: FAD-dependent monooxygenase [Steroidobacteraceae bacterium]|nr:FAD-dependent monooxygenase [Steroidobacteraceae bacterium]